MRWGLTVLRLIIGGTFMAHGAQKLFGSFEGPGLEGTAQGFGQMGMHPPKHQALAAGLSEFGGGALLVTGVAIPVATTSLSATMITAIWKVHKDNGFFASKGGFEFNLALLAGLFAIADGGPGALALGDDEPGGLRLAIGQLALGAAGAFAAMELGKRLAPADSGDEQPEAAAPAPAAS
jgi:putative oxidoreductase